MFAVLRGRALSRLEIDDHLEFHGLLDWQVAALSPLRIDPASRLARRNAPSFQKGSARLRSEVAVVEAQCLNPHNMGGTEFDKTCEVIR
jgi:hypothetical protein